MRLEQVMELLKSSEKIDSTESFKKSCQKNVFPFDTGYCVDMDEALAIVFIFLFFFFF